MQPILFPFGKMASVIYTCPSRKTVAGVVLNVIGRRLVKLFHHTNTVISPVAFGEKELEQ
jgi:hypothetical protein